MVIYLWRIPEVGVCWAYSWEMEKPAGARSVDLDRWFEYDLDEQEVLACLDAVERVEETINA